MTGKKDVFIYCCSIATLLFPLGHFILFKYLFERRAAGAYGTLDALRTGDGWKGYKLGMGYKKHVIDKWMKKGIIPFNIML